MRLVGIDTFSVDAPDSKDLLAHHAFFAGGVAILEGLDLGAASPGDWELCALPLRLVGSDASPVRAALRRPD
jgi:arylformamidase